MTHCSRAVIKLWSIGDRPATLHGQIFKIWNAQGTPFLQLLQVVSSCCKPQHAGGGGDGVAMLLQLHVECSYPAQRFTDVFWYQEQKLENSEHKMYAFCICCAGKPINCGLGCLLRKQGKVVQLQDVVLTVNRIEGKSYV